MNLERTTYADIMQDIVDYRRVMFDVPFELEGIGNRKYKITIDGVMESVNGSAFFFVGGVPAELLNIEDYPVVKNNDNQTDGALSTRAVLTLIRAHAENDETWFKAEALLIADRLEKAGNDQAASFIRGLL